MNTVAHTLIGAGSAGLIVWGLNSVDVELDTVTVSYGVAAAGVGAMLPDFDHPRLTINSGISRRLVYKGAQIILTILLGTGSLALALGGLPVLELGLTFLVVFAVFLALTAFFRSLSGHRSISHSLIFMVVATAIAIAACSVLKVNFWYGVLLGWGWCTHLIADIPCTGLPLLSWPFNRAT